MSFCSSSFRSTLSLKCQMAACVAAAASFTSSPGTFAAVFKSSTDLVGYEFSRTHLIFALRSAASAPDGQVLPHSPSWYLLPGEVGFPKSTQYTSSVSPVSSSRLIRPAPILSLWPARARPTESPLLSPSTSAKPLYVPLTPSACAGAARASVPPTARAETAAIADSREAVLRSCLRSMSRTPSIRGRSTDWGRRDDSRRLTVCSLGAGINIKSNCHSVVPRPLPFSGTTCRRAGINRTVDNCRAIFRQTHNSSGNRRRMPDSVPFAGFRAKRRCAPPRPRRAAPQAA